MTTGIIVLVCVLVGGMLLRMPIGFSMLTSGIAYLLVKHQDEGLAAEQICNGLYFRHQRRVLAGLADRLRHGTGAFIDG